MQEVREPIRYDVKNIIKRSFLMLSIPTMNIIYEMLNKDTGKAILMETNLDRLIPFNRFFIIPYVLWYGYIAFFLIYFCIIDAKQYYKLLGCMNAGLLVCYLIFYFFPTTVTRPVLNGNDIFIKLVKLIYLKDKPYNCFPSIHVLHSMLVALCVIEEDKISKVIKYISSFIAVSIIISTLFVKQHYIPDIVSGIILAISLYIIVCTVKAFILNSKAKNYENDKYIAK